MSESVFTAIPDTDHHIRQLWMANKRHWEHAEKKNNKVEKNRDRDRDRNRNRNRNRNTNKKETVVITYTG